jgi:hypothetical protein
VCVHCSGRRTDEFATDSWLQTSSARERRRGLCVVRPRLDVIDRVQSQQSNFI